MTNFRASGTLLALALVLAGCHKSKSPDEIAQDKLLIRDADIPGASSRITDEDAKATPPAPARRRAGDPAMGTRSSENGEPGSPCDSPRARDQHRCLKGLIAVSDAGLDRTYQQLIATISSRADVTGDRREARASVRRLRAAERQWLDYRDKECRRQTYETEGKLWARTRAKCLGEFSARRAAELSQNLAQVRGSAAAR